jgi:hypothetical protein
MAAVVLHTHDVLRRRLLASLDQRSVGLAELARTEWSPQFERYMRNRLAVGAFRYGRLQAPGKPAWDRIAGMEKRIAQYRQTGNTECLVDVANMALLEFFEGRHPLRHFEALSGGCRF